MSADRELLFGVLALQMGLVSRDQLVEALQAWPHRKDDSLAAVLRDHGALGADDCAALDRLVECHSVRHGGSVAASLSTPPFHDALSVLEQSGVLATINTVPPLPTTPCPPPPAPAPRVTPSASRYRTLRTHAKGGLGEVFLALDEELRREVALKRIQSPYSDHPESRARFVREAELTGKLEHPGVVPVYGLGADELGRPYYAMRFVQGESLERAIRRFHKADQAPRDEGERALALRGLLTRFVAVCNAVGYAHSKGVIHRDLKPDNVMLGEFGETLVVDWGLARALDQGDGSVTDWPSGDGAQTQHGKAMGTPAFMPPEQARGERDRVGVRSDVWAMGATLYYLLAGKSPYSGPESLRQAVEGQYRHPRQVNPRVPRALEAVCLKAMASDLEARYAAVREVGEEVERWLADEPVLAYREPARERLARWGRRHKALVGAAALLLTLGTAGLGVGLWAVRAEQTRTQSALDASEVNLERAVAAEKEASENLRLARKTVDDVMNTLLTDPLFQTSRMEKAKRKLLEIGLPVYKQLRERQPDDADLRREQAHRLFMVGYMEQMLGRRRESLEAYQEARTLMLRLVEEYPAVLRYRQDLAATHNNLAGLLNTLNRYEESLEEHRRAFRLRARMAADAPTVWSHQRELARSHDNIGALLKTLGRFEEALAEFRQGLRVTRALAAEARGDAASRRALARAHNSLGGVLWQTGRLEEAIREHQQARQILQRLVEEQPRNLEYQSELGRTYDHLGNVLNRLRKSSEAVEVFRGSRDLFAKLARDNPDLPGVRQNWGFAHHNLGLQLALLGRYQEALVEHLGARSVWKALVEEFPEDTYNRQRLDQAHAQLGDVLTSLGRREEALEQFRQAVRLRRELAKADPSQKPAVGRALVHMVFLLNKLDNPADALRYVDEAISLLDATRDRAYLREARRARAAALTALGRESEAAQERERARALDTPKPKR